MIEYRKVGLQDSSYELHWRPYFWGFLAYYIIFIVFTVFWRLYLSPLAKFPGPKLAALSGWYEFYYDYWCQGSYIYQIEQMHKDYGPLVRINPEELSLHDPDFYNEIYCFESRRKTDNYSHFGQGIGFDDSHFLTRAHDLHRRRRKLLEPFFSRAGIAKLDQTIKNLVKKLELRLLESRANASVVRLDHAFTAFSGDVIGSICCGELDGFLDEPDFAPFWYELLHKIIKSLPLMFGFPWMIHIIKLIPTRLAAWLNPDVMKLANFEALSRSHIEKAKAEQMKRARSPSGHSGGTLFEHLVTGNMPESELSTDRLTKEAQVLLGAGTVSTARTLDFIFFYVLNQPKILQKLRKELAPVMLNYPQDLPSVYALERLPYLTALIKEGLRLSFGNMHRLPRVSPNAAIQYKDWTIPPGTPVGMSSYLMHKDPNVYPEPDEFRPERWLETNNPDLDRNYVPFSRGSRSCLGINLAYAELYMVIAILLRPGGPQFQLFETDESDVVQVHDFLLPLPRLDSKGVRIKMV